MAADGPAPDALALLADFTLWHWQAPFGDFKALLDDMQCVPKSCVLGRKLRTSSFSSESHTKGSRSSLRLFLDEFTFKTGTFAVNGSFEWIYVLRLSLLIY